MQTRRRFPAVQASWFTLASLSIDVERLPLPRVDKIADPSRREVTRAVALTYKGWDIFFKDDGRAVATNSEVELKLLGGHFIRLTAILVPRPIRELTFAILHLESAIAPRLEDVCRLWSQTYTISRDFAFGTFECTTGVSAVSTDHGLEVRERGEMRGNENRNGFKSIQRRVCGVEINYKSIVPNFRNAVSLLEIPVV